MLTFKAGYFFSNGKLLTVFLEQFLISDDSEPAYYKPSDFGIRLGSVVEVVDTDKRHPTGAFLAFKDISLVPYDMKLIDTAALSTPEVFFA